MILSFFSLIFILSSFERLGPLQSAGYPPSFNYPTYYNYFHSPQYIREQYFPPSHPYHHRTISNNHYPSNNYREQIVNEYIRRNPSSTSRSIRPLSCSAPDGTTGICMFSLACRHANGRPIGLCKDNIYAGSCCRLSDKSSLAVLDPILAGVSIVPEIENFVEYPTGSQSNKSVSSPFKTSTTASYSSPVTQKITSSQSPSVFTSSLASSSSSPYSQSSSSSSTTASSGSAWSVQIVTSNNNVVDNDDKPESEGK